MRKVKGVFFVDYVKMMRHRKEVTWGSLLQPEDLLYLKEKIDPATWYPFDAFERLGLALLREVVDDDLEMVRAWGRASADALSARHASLVCFGNPMESMMRFQVLRKSFFDFDAMIVELITPDYTKLTIRYGMSNAAEEAATVQTLGFLERVLELSGAREIRHRFVSRAWEGDSSTRLELRWKEEGLRPAEAEGPATPPDGNRVR